MTFQSINAISISQFHDSCFETPAWHKMLSAQFESGIWQLIELNHRFNSSLWDEEDLARRTDVPDSAIATNKRAIDGFNQKRNDAIERIDEFILHSLQGITITPDAWLNSESAGSMIDRLSITSLKIRAMKLQTERIDATAEHIETCGQKLSRLKEQRHDLQSCFDTLLTRAQQGQAHYKIYRQFKMYNDPTMNPFLYQKRS